MILPEENVEDLADVPWDARNGIVFIPVRTVGEVLREAPGIELLPFFATRAGGRYVPGWSA